MRILTAKLGDDVVEVLLGTEALPFKYFYNRCHLPHVGNGGLFEGHGFTLGAIVTHGRLSADSCTNRVT